MKRVKVDFNKPCGKIKPMHAVNNGPIHSLSWELKSNVKAFSDAKIPYVRNHDASFYSSYGGEHTVDVHAIFPCFDADPNDAASYDFACTDAYLAAMVMAGAKPFYRLGSKIEHTVKKYGTLPPPDFKKWAVICEHIIRHYNEGWANGFHYNIEYWEIWNEPDLDPDDSTNKRNWGGTEDEFCEFFGIAVTHLKEKFPHLKIGGPASAGYVNRPFLEKLIKSIRDKGGANIDFFSWHRYTNDAENIVDMCYEVRKMLDELGLSETESILDEWNYVKGWGGEDWVKTVKAIKGLKGAAFTAAVMCACQNAPLDMLMYYDARPCCYNGLFSSDLISEKLKGYYPFLMFGELYESEAVELMLERGNAVFASAAKSESQKAIMITHYDDDESTPAKMVEIEVSGVKFGSQAEIYTLDADNDASLTDRLTVNGKICLEIPLYTTLLIKIS